MQKNEVEAFSNLKEISPCKVMAGGECSQTAQGVDVQNDPGGVEDEEGRAEDEVVKECCAVFRKEIRQAIGGQEVLQDDWTTITNVIRETGRRRVLGVS